MARIRCLELNISELCNYNCEYCIFHRNIKNKTIMSPWLAENIVKKYIEYLDGSNGHIYLGAGEPLLNWDAIVRVADVLRSHNNIWLSFMTNGSLITEENLIFIKKNNISVGLSLDGREETQLRNRPSKDERINSFEASINFLNLANKIGYEVFSISATYNKKDFLEDAKFVISLCKKYKVKEFDLDYDIDAIVIDEMDEIIDNLIEAYNLARRNGLSVFGYWLIPIINKRNKNTSELCYCDNAEGFNVCVSADGMCKICGYDSYEYGFFDNFNNFGNKELVDKYKQYDNGRGDCLDCDCYEFCMGQCIFKKDINRINCKMIKNILLREKELLQ